VTDVVLIVGLSAAVAALLLWLVRWGTRHRDD
jgi:hypothetical protein